MILTDVHSTEMRKYAPNLIKIRRKHAVLSFISFDYEKYPFIRNEVACTDSISFFSLEFMNLSSLSEKILKLLKLVLYWASKYNYCT